MSSNGKNPGYHTVVSSEAGEWFLRGLETAMRSGRVHLRRFKQGGRGRGSRRFLTNYVGPRGSPAVGLVDEDRFYIAAAASTAALKQMVKINLLPKPRHNVHYRNVGSCIFEIDPNLVLSAGADAEGCHFTRPLTVEGIDRHFLWLSRAAVAAHGFDFTPPPSRSVLSLLQNGSCKSRDETTKDGHPNDVDPAAGNPKSFACSCDPIHDGSRLAARIWPTPPSEGRTLLELVRFLDHINLEGFRQLLGELPDADENSLKDNRIAILTEQADSKDQEIAALRSRMGEMESSYSETISGLRERIERQSRSIINQSQSIAAMHGSPIRFNVWLQKAWECSGRDAQEFAAECFDHLEAFMDTHSGSCPREEDR